MMHKQIHRKLHTLKLICQLKIKLYTVNVQLSYTSQSYIEVKYVFQVLATSVVHAANSIIHMQQQLQLLRGTHFA